jgi:hypothetical protein
MMVGGSFLLDILPSNNELPTKMVYGTANAICLIVFLAAKFLILQKGASLIWQKLVFVSAILFLCFSFLYFNHYSNHYKKVWGNVKLITAEHSDWANKLCVADSVEVKIRYIDCENYLAANFIDQKDKFWDKPSIQKVKSLFIIYYGLIVLFLSFVVFSLIEMINIRSNREDYS